MCKGRSGSCRRMGAEGHAIQAWCRDHHATARKGAMVVLVGVGDILPSCLASRKPCPIADVEGWLYWIVSDG